MPGAKINGYGCVLKTNIYPKSYTYILWKFRLKTVLQELAMRRIGESPTESKHLKRKSAFPPSIKLI